MVGVVVKNQALMIMTFDEDQVEFLASSLQKALEDSYRYLDFFTFKEEEENPWK